MRRLGRNVPTATTTRTCAAQGSRPPSQTAWAVLGLLAAGKHDRASDGPRHRTTCSTPSSPTARGTEPEFTGTGFPRVFYLKYHYYRIYFPLMALARWSETLGEQAEQVETAAQMPLRLEVPSDS